jgi:hypothetical protein
VCIVAEEVQPKGSHIPGCLCMDEEDAKVNVERDDKGAQGLIVLEAHVAGDFESIPVDSNSLPIRFVTMLWVKFVEIDRTEVVVDDGSDNSWLNLREERKK